MKRAFAVILALSILVLMSIVETSAYTAPRMKVDIGFSFYVGEDQLPAGNYWLEMVNMGTGGIVGSAPAIRNQDGSVYQFLPARAQGSYKNDPSSYLVFNRIGDSYFLTKVHHGSVDVQLPKSRAQKEVARAYPAGSREAAGTIVTVAAEFQR